MSRRTRWMFPAVVATVLATWASPATAAAPDLAGSGAVGSQVAGPAAVANLTGSGPIGSPATGSGPAGDLAGSGARGGSAAGPAAPRPAPQTLRRVRLADWGGGGYVFQVHPDGRLLGALYDEQSNAQPVIWTDYDTPVPLGIDRGDPRAMNRLGHVAGTGGEPLPSGESIYDAGWLWTPEGITVLRSTGAVRVTDLNDRDQIVGNVAGAGAFIWEHGRFTMLGAPEGWTSSATEVNNRGEVLGALTRDGEWISEYSFIWRNGSMTVLPTTNFFPARLTHINDEGLALGHGDLRNNGISHPFLWDGRRLVDLMADRPNESGEAWQLNNAGDVLGNAGGKNVLWRHGRMIELDPGGVVLSERGDVAGVHAKMGPDGPYGLWTYRVFRWREGTVVYSEPMLGEEPNFSLKGMDDFGRIVAAVDGTAGGVADGLMAWLPRLERASG